MTTPTPATVPPAPAEAGHVNPDRPLTLTQARHLSDLVLAALAASGAHIEAVAWYGCGSDRVDPLRDASAEAHEAFLHAVYGLECLSDGQARHLSDLVLAALAANGRHISAIRPRRRHRVRHAIRLARLRKAAATTHEAFLAAVFALVDDRPAVVAGQFATTDPQVLTAGVAQGWADPEPDPVEIDWPVRQATALIPFTVVAGRPVTPAQPRGLLGRAGLGRWGENPMCDALVTACLDGLRRVLLVERGDGAGWALPGGSIEPGESPQAAAVRELAEETGLHLPVTASWQAWAPRWVPDPRGTDESWAVTVPHHTDLGDVTDLTGLPGVTGGDDADRAAWIPAPDYPCLHAHLTAIGGRVFPAHTGLLTDLLDTTEDPR